MSSRADAFLETIRAAQEQFNRGDYETALAGVAPDAVWEFGAWVFDGGVVEGRDAVVRYFESLGDGIRWTVLAQDATELDDGRILVRQHGTAVGRTTGIAEDMEFFSIFELDETGRVRRVTEFETRDEVEAALS